MNYSSHIKKMLRTWATEAYRRELERELNNLEKDLSAWKSGRISSEELRHRIHAWDTGPSRALGKQYDYGQLDANVAYAVVIGILKEHELSDELLAALEPSLEIYRKMKADRRLADRKGEWWK
jgi:hypothetical protein